MKRFLSNKNILISGSLAVLVLVIIFSPAIKIDRVFGQFVELQRDSDGNYYYTDSSTGDKVQTGYNVSNISSAPSASNPGNTNSGSSDSKQGSVKPNDPSKAIDGKATVPTMSGSKKSDEDDDALTQATTCLVSELLAQALTGVVYAGIGALTGTIEVTNVPVKEAVLQAKDTGLTLYGVPILPSWDSIGYCLVNTLIATISNETIKWIQDGFDGAPAFVEDPTALFQNIADYEVSNFLENFMDGVLCEPFAVSVKLQLVQQYTNDYSTYGRCTLDTVSGNIKGFLRGETFSYEEWFAVTQNPANNPYGAYLMADAEARNRITINVGRYKIETDWGNGYFNWTNDETGKTMTPGKVIQSGLEKTLGLTKDRLVLADEFDKIVTALVDYLIHTALNETLGNIN